MKMSRFNNRNAMMHQQSYSAEPYREGIEYTPEAWAYGLRALPGSLANQLQALGEYTTGKDYPNKLGNYLDELTQVNEMGYTPQTEYEQAVAFLPELVYDPALIAGTPYAAYKGIKNAPKLLNTLSDDALTTPMRNQLGMITWQGSPHKYDGTLDPTKIGTGEGAQAYGYGHYLAESPDVAKQYQMMGSKVSVRPLPNGKMEVLSGPRDGDLQSLGEFDVDEAFELMNQQQLAHGSMYKFDLDDNAIANMLDWDAPLSEQPEVVRNALQREFTTNLSDKELLDAFLSSEYAQAFPNAADVRRAKETATGEGLYDLADWAEKERKQGTTGFNLFTGDTGAQVYERIGARLGKPNASSYLKELGIPGIKYYDGSSRAAGEGTRNFVVFPGNENLVTPLERNGEPLGNLPKR